ncbi:MAG TPA: DNA primase, partial [Gemmataceae bacterium]
MRGRRDDVVEEVRSRVDIVDVVSDYVTLRRAGKNYVGLCPFHDEDTPSFTVSPDRQMFYCFGCQKGGDVFTFLMEQRGLDFRQALEVLAERAGVALPERALTPEQRRELERRRRLLDLLERAARYFENLLQRSPGAEGARRYVRERGLQPATVHAFRLGWSEPEWAALSAGLRERGVDDDLLVEAGLAVRKEDGSLYDRFRGRLMFPILDERGRVIAFGGRAFGDDQPKYLNSPETPLFQKSRVLYALDRARGPMRQHGRALIVEGYMDAVTAHQAGFDYAVASLGTALGLEQARVLTRYASRVYIAYDADAAGEQATLRGLEHFARLGYAADVLIVRLPAGHDPDSFIRERGAAAFQELLDRAQPLVDYVFDRALAAHDTARPEGKGQVVRAVAPWWGALASPV